MTILSTIMGVESSGGHNVPQGQIGDINNIRGTPAQGYFQITDPTWLQFGGSATGFSSAIQAPYSTQVDIAQNIPVARWGNNTISALAQNGYTAAPGETLGQMMARYGESPSLTSAADGSTYGTPIISSTGASPSEAFDPNSGMFDANSQLGQPTTFGSPGVTVAPGVSSTMSDQQSADFVMGPSSGDNVSVSTTQAPVQDDITQFQVAGVNAPAATGVSTTAAPQGQGTNTQGGTPINNNLTDATSVGANGLNAVAKAATGVGQAVQSAEGNAAAAGTSWLGSIFQAGTSLLVRGGFIMVGLVILLGALLLFYAEARAKAS